MKKFRLEYNTITEHEILSENKKFIAYKRAGCETKELKDGVHSKWFDTREQAINYNIIRLESKIKTREISLQLLKETLEGFIIDNPL